MIAAVGYRCLFVDEHAAGMAWTAAVHAPIVVLGNSWTSEQALRRRLPHCVTCLRKPFDSARVTKALSEIVSLRISAHRLGI